MLTARLERMVAKELVFAVAVKPTEEEGLDVLCQTVEPVWAVTQKWNITANN